MAFSAAQGAVISVSVDGVAASQRQIDGLSQSMGRLADTVQGAMRNLAATAGLGGGIAAIIDQSDQYAKLTSQLRLATDSANAYAVAYSEVKRISTESQSDLASTGVLYARIANGTKDLGVSQQRVAAITEVVNLALKVGAATTEEAASAQLQLSQAFAAGALRGEDFNAVNEAAPRLMKALADGIGVPVGALKQMASEGKITSEIMAEVLPRSLEQLRQEATQVQTIGGAFTNLKNQVMEFTATSAQSNGTVALMTGSLTLLADNLRLVAGALGTVTAVKAATWAQSWITETYRKIAADQAARTATLAAAQATLTAAEADLARVQATGAQAAATEAAIAIARAEMTTRLGQANANMAAARAAIAAATAAGTQSFALRTLQLATAELAGAETARGAALAELATLGQQQVRVSAEIAAARVAEAAATRAVAAAQEGAALGTGLASRALGLLGGPVGAVITVLGIAATAWSVYGSKAEDANKQAAESAATSTPEIVANLEKQNAKLRERLALMKSGPPELAKDSGADAQQLASILSQINALAQKSNELKAQGKELDAGDQAQLYALGLQYSNLTQAMQANKGLKAEIDANGTALTNLIAVRERLTGVDKQYLEDLNTLQTALDKGAIGQQEYIALVSQLATEEYKKSQSGKATIDATKKEADAYATLISSIRTKIAENQIELQVGQSATDSQKQTAKLDQDLATGKLKLSSAHLAVARAALVALGVSEQQLKQDEAQRDMAKYISASAVARQEAAASLQVEYALYGKTSDARDIAMVKVRLEAEAEKKLADLRANQKPVTDRMIADLNAETAARVQAEQATLAQGKALQYAAQLADENKRFGIDYIADDKARAAAQLAIDADLWQQRIKLAGDGTEAQKILQQQYDTWYQNQLLKPELDANKKLWDGIEQAAHDTFLSIENGAKSAADRAKQALENGLFEWLYQMVARPWIVNLQSSLGMGSVGSLAQAAGTTGGPAVGAAAANPLIGAAQTVSSMYKLASGGFDGLADTVAGGAQSLMSSMGYTPLASQGLATASGQALTPLASMAGTAASYGAGVLGGHYIGNAIAGDYSVNHGQAVTNIASVVGAAIAGPIGGAIGGAIGGLFNRAFGMGDKKVTSQGMRGTLTATSLAGTDYSNWHQDGGWFRSDKNGTDKTALSADTVAQFTQGLQALEAASAGFASSLGVSADSIKDYSKTFDLTLTGDAAKDSQTVTDFFTGVGDELATRLVPNLASFEKSGETASAALQRLAGDFASTNQVAQLLGKSATQVFGSLGVDSAAAREQLINLAGGVSTLTQEAQSYAQNFLTDAQRLAPVQDAVDAAMSSLGLAWVQTREQFKSVVDSLDLTTQAGAQEFASLMALSDAFAQVHQNTVSLARSEADIASERKDLQNQYDQLTMTSAQLLDKQRAALDASNQSLFDQVQAAQKVKDAQDAAKTSLGNFITQMTSFATTASGLNGNLRLGNLSTLTPEQQLAEARRQFEQTRQQAAAGDTTAQGSLQTIEQTFLQLSQKINGGDAAYSSDLATVMQTNDQLASWAKDSVDVAQSSLDALDDSNATLTDISNTLSAIAQGVQYLPEALTGSGSTAGVTQAFGGLDYSQMGTTGMTPLVDEIKALRAQVADLLTEAKGRRADAQQQTGDQIAAGAAAVQQAANTVVAGLHGAATDAAWAVNNQTRALS